MRPKLLLLAIFVVGVAFEIERTMADFDGLIDIDGDSDAPVSDSVSRRSVRSSEFEGDDEDDYSGSVMSDESGSGSGYESTTEPSSIVDVSVVSPTTDEPAVTTQKTTTIDNKITEDTEEPTEEEYTDEPTGGEGDDMFGGGVSETDPPNEADSPNAEARVDEKTVLTVLTTEVIAAVVVGAVCAVILIAFLVYRLRKRDEGSYALSDAGYKDTYKLQGDTGKEAFVWTKVDRFLFCSWTFVNEHKKLFLPR